MLWAKRALGALFPLRADQLRGLDDATDGDHRSVCCQVCKTARRNGCEVAAVLELTKEQGDLEAYLDKLNRLEKIGALPAVDEWLELREMRNAFAHDYPEDSELQTAILNRAYMAADRLVEILQHVKQFAMRYEHE